MEIRSKFTPVTVEWLANNTITNERGCWVWQRGRNKTGYALTYPDGRTTLAHRLMWMLLHGQIPVGLGVLHQCDNPPCINPEHLYIGTQKRNMQDALVRGRTRYVPHIGSDNGNHKLTEQDVLFIRQSRLKLADLAELFGVHLSNISLIRRSKTWKHI